MCDPVSCEVTCSRRGGLKQPCVCDDDAPRLLSCKTLTETVFEASPETARESLVFHYDPDPGYDPNAKIWEQIHEQGARILDHTGKVIGQIDPATPGETEGELVAEFHRAPRRIQRKRTRGWRMPDNATYVGRPSRWGNPFRAGQIVHVQARDEVGDSAVVACGAFINTHEAVELYRMFMGVTCALRPSRLEELRSELAGRDLACWCPLDSPCHADVLLELANGGG